jgi:hypothetical protein
MKPEFNKIEINKEVYIEFEEDRPKYKEFGAYIQGRITDSRTEVLIEGHEFYDYYKAETDAPDADTIELLVIQDASGTEWEIPYVDIKTIIYT